MKKKMDGSDVNENYFPVISGRIVFWGKFII
jgi:hypothetical protein